MNDTANTEPPVLVWTSGEAQGIGSGYANQFGDYLDHNEGHDGTPSYDKVYVLEDNGTLTECTVTTRTTPFDPETDYATCTVTISKDGTQIAQTSYTIDGRA